MNFIQIPLDLHWVGGPHRVVVIDQVNISGGIRGGQPESILVHAGTMMEDIHGCVPWTKLKGHPVIVALHGNFSVRRNLFLAALQVVR